MKANSPKPPAWPAVGDLVSIERWDRTERHANRIGSPATVTDVSPAVCQSGFMVTVKGTSGRMLQADIGWLKPWDGTLKKS